MAAVCSATEIGALGAVADMVGGCCRDTEGGLRPWVGELKARLVWWRLRRRGKLSFDQRDVVVSIQYAGLDGGGAAGVFVEIDVELLDGVKKYQEVLVAGALGQVARDSLQACVAAVEGWRCQTVCVSLRDLCDGSPGFFGGLSQVLELELGVGLL